MPQINPMKLLQCLSVLLSPKGGIKSRDEVQKLASLMAKYSKKLVSKCIYIQILKYTETELLNLFMGSGGWRLAHMWLTESIVAKNWPLVRELLELLLLCPVDIEMLKTNNCPKLVKELSKDENYFAIGVLATKLVEQWLRAVKGDPITPFSISDISTVLDKAALENEREVSSTQDKVNPKEKKNKLEELVNGNDTIMTVSTSVKVENDVDIENMKHIKMKSEPKDIVKIEPEDIKSEPEDNSETLPVLKLASDGKEIIEKIENSDSKLDKSSSSSKDKSSKHSSRSKDRSSSSESKSKSSRHSSKSHSSSSSDKSKSRKSSPSRHNSSSSKDKSKEKSKHSSESSKARDKKSSDSGSGNRSKSSKHKEDKDKHKEKSEKIDKETKDQSTKNRDPEKPSIHKLGKIPKLSEVKKEKPSISIEVRKPDDPKPKTVKTFHSKFRKHGLDEEVKPPPSRATILSKKNPTPTPAPVITITKRSSPVHTEPPPEKKPKTMETIEKPGAIKLIPAKPKRKLRTK